MSRSKKNEPILSALVTEDHPLSRAGLVAFLKERCGVRKVHEADRFKTAIDFLSQQEVTVAFFDLGIPGLESAEDLVQVRRRWPKVKVVVLSGSSRRTDILSALEAGVHGYFVKTASMDNLADRLGQIMAGEICVPPSLADLDSGTGSSASSGSEYPAEPSILAQLTERQLEVLGYLVDGLGNKEIAEKLGRSESMAKGHVSAVIKTLNARSRTHAASIGRLLLGG